MLRTHAQYIYENAIKDNLPDSAVKKAIETMPNYSGKLILVAIGKASYQMAKTACKRLGDKIDNGIVITKYGHRGEDLPKIEIYEASHPVLDESTLIATKRALEITENLTENDLILFLVSGGGSALFEDVSCSLKGMQDLTDSLLKCGASIEKINTVRKHISNVKGGKFALHCAPAKIYGIVLSDVIGNRLDMIASGPACSDCTTVDDALKILNKYNVSVSEDIIKLISRETPKVINNATHVISGSVSELCKSAYKYAAELGYKATIICDNIGCEARKLGKYLGELAKEHQNSDTPLAFIVGGETVVHVKGKGLGGRNQEIALSAAIEIKGLKNVSVFSVGSDGTDGPTNSAGGYVDGYSYDLICKTGISPMKFLENNSSNDALLLCNGHIITGPTGTNVNDVSVVLITSNT